MSFSTKTTKMLWGRSGNRCAICKTELFVDATETDDETHIGDMCHIVAQKEDGPRGKDVLIEEQRDKYSNLILLCKNHHKIIDAQPAEYTVEKLHAIKTEHETWVSEQLSQDDVEARKHAELVASYVDQLIKSAHLDDWDIWTSWLTAAGSQRLDKNIYEDLSGLSEWVLSRVWPHGYDDVKDAFTTVRWVINDLVNVFSEHMKEADDLYYYDKFYKSGGWVSQEKYDRLGKIYNFNVALIDDLTIETARALNHLSQVVRDKLVPSFRLKEGLFLYRTGMTMNLSSYTYRPEYTEEELAISIPYPGLEKFKEIRSTRSIHIGKGINP